MKKIPAHINTLITGFFRNQLSQHQLDQLDAWIIASEENELLFEEIVDMGGVPEKKSYNYSWAIAALLILLLALTWLINSLVSTKDQLSSGMVSGFSMDTLSKLKEPALLLNQKEIIFLHQIKKKLSAYPYLELDEAVQKIRILRSAPRQTFLFINPSGSIWNLQLSDNSLVELNADSRICFPSAAHLMPRQLELSGEAFFTVSASQINPFTVKMKDIRVTATGTAFNINTHSTDSTIRTSVFEGKIKIYTSMDSILLSQGMEVIATSSKLVSGEFNTQQITAWRNHQFYFKDTPIREVLEQISHWYGLQIVYNRPVDFHLNALVPFSTPLPDLLLLLEKTGHAQFTLRGDTLIVDPS